MAELSIERKKKFIVANEMILNRDMKLRILGLIMVEIGESILIETAGKKEIDINLDLLEEKGIEILNHIYNIIKNRLDTLNKPARIYELQQ